MGIKIMNIFNFSPYRASNTEKSIGAMYAEHAMFAENAEYAMYQGTEEELTELVKLHGDEDAYMKAFGKVREVHACQFSRILKNHCISI